MGSGTARNPPQACDLLGFSALFCNVDNRSLCYRVIQQRIPSAWSRCLPLVSKSA